MSFSHRVAGAVTTHARIVLLVMLIATAAVGAGVTMIENDTSLDQFTGDSPEARADDYVDANFTTAGEENTTQALVVRTGENVLTRASLLDSLRLQRAIRANDSINDTLVEDDPITGVENVVAIRSIREDQFDELEARVDELEARRDDLNATEDRLLAGINRTRNLTRAFANDTADLDENSSTYEDREARLEADIAAVVKNATVGLGSFAGDNYETFLLERVRPAESNLVELERQYGENATDREAYRDNVSTIERQYDLATGLLDRQFNDLFREFGDVADEFDELSDADRPPVEDQIEALQNESEFDRLLRQTLNGSGTRGDEVLDLVAASYELNSTTAEARITVLTQRTSGAGGLELGVTDPRVIESQLQLREFVAQYEAGRAVVGAPPAMRPDDGPEEASGGGEYLVFGSGMIEDEIDRSMADSLGIIGPFTLLFVVLALAIAYRDLLDIVLGVAGIVAVLVWTFGLLGWSGLPFNVLFVAVPILLIGLSIDFAIHVFMRHRERRRDEGFDDSVRGSMTVALAGVGVALAWVTVTTSIGFLANAVSPLSVIRQFGVVGAFGILSTFLVFGVLLPAAKVELDELLESYGLDRRKRALATGGGRLGRALSAGAIAARRAPLAVLVAVLLLTAGGAYGATQVDTTFEQREFIAQSPPEWTGNLPGGMAPGTYYAADTLDVVDENFRRESARAQVLVRGNVTDDAFLQRLANASDAASRGDVVFTLPDGEADIDGPVSVMRDTSAENDSFNISYRVADTSNDGVPDDDIGELYDELFDADRDRASEVIHRTDDGEYRAVRLIVGVRGDATYAETTADMRAVAAAIEGDPTSDVRIDVPGTDEGTGATTGTRTDGAGNWTAVATGGPVVNHVIEEFLFDSLTEAFLAAFVAILIFLSIAYRLAGHGATLGAVTLLPVALSITWILGTMYLLGMPFNVLTVMITSLGIGLGVDYSIHVSTRYRLELDRAENAWDAMETTLTGTGGALLGSAATTTAAFGTLALAILPVIRQFGVIAAVSIGYSFLASVFVLPTLLLLWTRYVGPDASFTPRVSGDSE
jgi:predicted RND superfamily exporter protein